MAIFGNFKGTTQTDFKIGKRGPTLFTSPRDGSSYTLAGQLEGDYWIDPGNSTINVYTTELVNGNIVADWRSIGSYLSDLNVDNGTLFVDSSNDTVSIGSTSSNEKLFVNGSLRLGTNPSIKYSGAYLDLKHANGTGTVVRVRDNTGNNNPVFKIYGSNNTNEVFKVEGTNVTIANSYILPTEDGTNGQVITTDGNGVLTFGNIAASTTAAGANGQIQFNESGTLAANASLTYDSANYVLQTGVVRGILFEQITEYGDMSAPVVLGYNYGSITNSTTSIGSYGYMSATVGEVSQSFTVGTLPNPSVPGQMIFVSNESGGATMAFSDGTNWRRVQDRAIVS